MSRWIGFALVVVLMAVLLGGFAYGLVTDTNTVPLIAGYIGWGGILFIVLYGVVWGWDMDA